MPPVDSRIKVLRIIARMNVGGPAIQITNLMRGLDSNRFNHKLITGYCDESESDYLETVAEDISAHRLNGLGRKVNLISDFQTLYKLIRIIREFRPQIIHTHTGKAGLVGRIASILSLHKSIRIHTFHGHLLTGYFSKNKTKLVIAAEKILSCFTDKYISVGISVRDDLLKAGIGNINKFMIFPPGLELPRIPNREVSSRNLGLPSDEIYCLFLGRITKIKRPDRLIDVARVLKAKNINLKFLVAGGGDLLQEMQTTTSQDRLPFIYLGWVSEISNVLGISDLMLLTSDNEGTPISLIQGQLAGIPVVSTNVGSVSEVIVDGASGFLTNLNVEEISQKIQLLVENPIMRIEMGLIGKNFAQDKFGITRLVNDHASLYESCLNNPANV